VNHRYASVQCPEHEQPDQGHERTRHHQPRACCKTQERQPDDRRRMALPRCMVMMVLMAMVMRMPMVVRMTVVMRLSVPMILHGQNHLTWRAAGAVARRRQYVIL